MNDIREAARWAKDASRILASLPSSTKNAVLMTLAEVLRSDRETILNANAADMHAARAAGLPEAKLRRLVLTPDSIDQIAAGVEQVAAMRDPIGSVTRDDTVPSGLRVQKIRSPLGVIAMIYEARPGVTVDAFVLCFKAGNACLLKGGREAIHSNEALLGLARRALAAHGCPAHAIELVTTSDREELKLMLTLSDSIDLVIPRGGETLIRFVHEHARVPTIQHFQGVCHVYVDRSADLEKAIEIVATGKTSAPATCNTTECVLIHSEIANAFVPRLVGRAESDGFQIRADQQFRSLAGRSDAVVPASENDFGTEFLDLILAAKVVGSLDEAITHITRFASDHTEAIVAEDESAQQQFVSRVTSSCVLVNASTRFNDGFQLGLGAEIGISTSRLHAYGPMGLEELTTQRFVVTGQGHTR